MLGLSHVSLRLPALFGALLYICAAYWLAQTLTARTRSQIPVFLCLVYNPLVFDYFTVGRGYSLALAGLVGALAMALWAREAAFRRPRLFPGTECRHCVCIAGHLVFGELFICVCGLRGTWDSWRCGPSGEDPEKPRRWRRPLFLWPQ